MRLCRSILFILAALPAALQAGDEVDQQRTVSSDGVVEIQNTRGAVKITGWEEDVVRISGELDDLATGLTFEVEDGVTLIRVDMPKRDINHGDGSDLHIRVPRRSRVEFDGVSTDVVVSEIAGGTGVHSVSGDVRALRLDNRIRIKSVSGEVDVGQATGKIRVSTVSGDMHLDLDTSEIAVDAVSGEVRLRLGDFDRLTVSTVSGDQDVAGHLNDSGHVSMRSVNGEMSLRFSDKVNAQIDVKTGPGGDISNHMTADEPEDVFPVQMKLRTTLGDGSGTVTMNTVNGDIKLLSGR
ncbi:MAG: DUF4097 family beta strand repeat-containing protein [Pseudomonadales bacterium]|nr:DUF4097 family beta strand repeat-containing protein [Pseudomonadales bacterium]MDP7359765.1 DUF4097 family beta strand repeat-containing protein [Pseudomonadales bacterium]MDP7596993.1 DUF4097 family beta strand repeat-containing protein [Pseudomonadales bacterium]HJN52196.1 DUF4097 family beta strand repeat-containing protein [Pseudomonadales bacterium]